MILQHLFRNVTFVYWEFSYFFIQSCTKFLNCCKNNKQEISYSKIQWYLDDSKKIYKINKFRDRKVLQTTFLLHYIFFFQLLRSHLLRINPRKQSLWHMRRQLSLFYVHSHRAFVCNRFGRVKRLRMYIVAATTLILYLYKTCYFIGLVVNLADAKEFSQATIRTYYILERVFLRSFCI